MLGNTEINNKIKTNDIKHFCNIWNGNRKKLQLGVITMMKIDVKCIKPCEAKGPKLITPGRNGEGISVLIRCTSCEVVPQNKSGSSKS